MKLKPLVLVLLAFVLLLSACSSGAGEAPAEDEAENGDATNEEANEDATGEEEDSAEQLSLSWMVWTNQANSILPEDESLDFVKPVIEEKFNVELELNYMAAGNDYDNQLNVQIAGGDVPDMFLATGHMSQTYALDGVTADMTPFVSPATMPNYFEWVTETELERYAVENKFVRAPIPFARNIYRSYYVRQDWLDELGLEVPDSYESLLDVMRAFTFDDPDGNGQNDTYGMSASGNGKNISYDFPQWIHNGLIGGMTIKDGYFVDSGSDPRIEGLINDLVPMLDEGIVDPDWFLNEGLAHQDKAAQGKVGVIVAGAKNDMFESNPNSILNRTRAVHPDAEWTPFNPFPDADGVWTKALPGSPFVFPASVAEEEPEKIERSVEILDWLAGEEGYLLTHYGKEGEHYTRDGNTITIDPDAIDADIIQQGNFLDIYDFFTPEEPGVLGLEVVDPRMTDHDREIQETVEAYPLVEYVGTNVSPPEGFNLADFRAKMYEYQTKMLFDEKSGDNWPEYREELMTEYDGRAVFEAYTEQIRAAGFELEDFE